MVLNNSDLEKRVKVLFADGAPALIKFGHQWRTVWDTIDANLTVTYSQEGKTLKPDDPGFAFPSGYSNGVRLKTLEERFGLRACNELEQAIQLVDRHNPDLIFLSSSLDKGMSDATQARIADLGIAITDNHAETLYNYITFRNKSEMIRGGSMAKIILINYPSIEGLPGKPEFFHLKSKGVYGHVERPVTAEKISEIIEYYLFSHTAEQRFTPRDLALKTISIKLDSGQVSSVSREDLDTLLRPSFERRIYLEEPIAQGQIVVQGAATGRLMTPAFAYQYMRTSKKRDIILCIDDNLRDFPPNLGQLAGMVSRTPVLQGSHEGEMAEAYGIPCIGNLQEITFKGDNILIKDYVINQPHDFIAMDATAGDIFFSKDIREGKAEVVEPEVLQVIRGDIKPSAATIEWQVYQRLMYAAIKTIKTKAPHLKISVNAANALEIETAKKLGEGFDNNEHVQALSLVGIIKTEEHFLGMNREILYDLLAANQTEKTDLKQSSYSRFVEYEKMVLMNILKAAGEIPIQIRLPDPELRLLDPDMQLMNSFITKHGVKKEQIEQLNDLLSSNGFLGIRGAHFGIRYPFVYEGVIEAIKQVYQEKDLIPSIMIPFVSSQIQLDAIKNMVERVGLQKVRYGMMCETFQSCLQLNKYLEKGVEFVHIGTGDLTQVAEGLTRADQRFAVMQPYREANLPYEDPYVVLGDSTKTLMRMVWKQRKNHPTLEIGTGGNHMTHPDNLRYVAPHLTYISSTTKTLPKVCLELAKVLDPPN